MKMRNIKQIRKYREVTEKNLAELIKRTGSDFSVQDIKNAVYNENGNEDFNNLVAKFTKEKNLDQLNKDLQIISDAWNYFPHKVLGGISPAEKLLEHHNKSKK